MADEAELTGRAAVIAGEPLIAHRIGGLLAQAGARVLIATPPQSEPIETNIPTLALDAADEAQWQGVTAWLYSAAERFDIMINAHASRPALSMQEMTLEAFRSHHRQVLHASFLGVRFAAAAMRRHGQGGSILTITGLRARRSQGNDGAEASTDGGLRLLSKAAALELGPEQIRVNTLQCDTDRATMDDIAQGALFLASHRSRFMTGADLVIDGGLLAGV